MSAAAGAARPGPGRPPSGARERVLAAGLEVLKADGYAGLTTAKVAARSGQNKALISYHFGSKQGLVASVGRELAHSITEEVLGGLDSGRTVEDVVRGVLDGVWRVMDGDWRLARLYFDLAAVAVVEPEVKAVMREMKEGWRRVLAGLLAETRDGPDGAGAEAATVWVIAGVEGLMLERLDRGETAALDGACELFVRSADPACVVRSAESPRMRISAKADYAVRAAAELAAAARDQPVKGELVAGAQQIPIKFLENILVDLRQAGIVQSRRGPDGGYWLARPAADVTVADVIRAADGPLASVRGEKPEDLSYVGAAASLRDVWVALRAGMRDVLEHVTLADLAQGTLAPDVLERTRDPEAWLRRRRT